MSPHFSIHNLRKKFIQLHFRSGLSWSIQSMPVCICVWTSSPRIGLCASQKSITDFFILWFLGFFPEKGAHTLGERRKKSKQEKNYLKREDKKNFQNIKTKRRKYNKKEKKREEKKIKEEKLIRRENMKKNTQFYIWGGGRALLRGSFRFWCVYTTGQKAKIPQLDEKM